MKQLKQYIPDLIILVVFVIASMIYFAPALEGKIIYASDNLQAIGANHQSATYRETTGESAWWVDAMFSGMPSYQVGGGRYLIVKVLYPFFRFLHWGQRNVFFYLLFYLVAFYFLLRAFNVRKWIAMAGAFAMALSSYFLIVIAATHYGKPISITWMSMVLAGFVITYRGKYAWGGFLTAFFTLFGFYSHPQMSYYMCLLIGMCWCAELAICIQSKSWKHFSLATLVFAASFAIGLAANAASFLTNREYQDETMRGGHSDLVKDDNTAGYKADKGLSLDYATAWSYGIDETMTLLIPEFEGGASGYNVGDKSLLYKELTKVGVPKKQAKGFCESAPTYRGEKAFTSGAVYVGAIVCFLFLLGILIVPGAYKWALLAATLFSILLSWGRHFMPLTEFFFQYFPMYNKFRAVESILVVAEITMPLLGFLGLKAIADKHYDWKRTRLYICLASGVTALICLITALAANSIDVTSSYDAAWKGQMGDKIYQLILDQRTAMISNSAWRSLLFVCIGFVLTYGYALCTYNQYNKKSILYQHTDICFGVLLAAFIILDLWPVDKHFCNDSLFRTPQERDKFFAMQDWEREILQDDGYFRVLNLTTSTFNDARTSYRLNSIGGYSAAKLRRYQDIIDEHISKEINPLYQTIYSTQGFYLPDPNEGADFPVLNMLNMKYAIVGGQNNQKIVVQNPYAMGAAWFVDDIFEVETPNEECDALREVNLRTTAVVAKEFATLESGLTNLETGLTTHESHIELVSQDHVRKRYHAVTKTSKVAVFSEVYYPKGWKVYIDNQPATHFRANYLLRAMVVPAGEHDILFVCAPDSVRIGDIISMICLVLMLSLLGWAVYSHLMNRRNPNE